MARTGTSVTCLWPCLQTELVTVGRNVSTKKVGNWASNPGSGSMQLHNCCLQRSREQTVDVRIQKCKTRCGWVWEWQSLLVFRACTCAGFFPVPSLQAGCPQASYPLCKPALGAIPSPFFQETFSWCVKRCGPALHAAEVVLSGSLGKQRFLKHSPNSFQN